MASYSDRETDRMLAELEARIIEIYDAAQSEVEKKASDYFASFADRYAKEYAAYQDGKYTKEQFDAWYRAQVGRGKRWEQLRDDLAKRLTNANALAAAYINDNTPGIYSLNANYAAYQIYNSTGVDFLLVDEATIRNLLTNNELNILPLNLNIPESERWNAKQLENALASGIIQGKSSGKIADEFQRVTNMDRVSALRNARTATTGAQNAGRQDSYNRATEMGIEIEKEWIATEDARTRESHAELDGVRVKHNEKFPNGLMYPGDSNGRPEEVYNCRCTVRAILPKYNGKARASEIEGHTGEHTKETYKEWEDRKREEKMKNSKPYTHADATARGMAAVEDRQEGYAQAPRYGTPGIGGENMEYNEKKEIMEYVYRELKDSPGIFVNRADRLYEYAKKIEPIDNYTDFTCHADAETFTIRLNANDESSGIDFSGAEYAELIKNSKHYNGGDIRVLSCSAGALDGGVAQDLANALGVKVMAPTETLTVDNDGRIFISNNKVLTDMWFDAPKEEKDSYIQTGHWKVFEPEK